MSIFDDLVNVFQKPADDSFFAKELKEIERWNQINKSLERGDHISEIKIDQQNSPLARMEHTLEAINEKLEIEHQSRLEADKAFRKQAVIDKRRFILNTIIGVVSAVAAVAGAIFSAISFFS